MKVLEDLCSVPLGYLMYVCYQIVKNYGAAIAVFTLLTKVILLPLSIWVQKNSVKIVRITPELNHIKANFFGDKDTIAEKTSDLYKREGYNPFASIIPMLIQIVLLMGLIQVIYNPLTHLFHVNPQVSTEMVSLTHELTGADLESSSIQMTVVDTIKNEAYVDKFLKLQEKFPDTDMKELVAEIQDTNMSLFGFSLGDIPSSKRGLTLLMPIVAAMAAWILCVGQNRLNPLQAEQGKLNQVGMTVFSVGISLILGAFVPLGVGLYWIWSNLFGLLLQVGLNKIIDPKKYIDYEELEKSKQELAGLEDLGKTKGTAAEKKELSKREKADYKRFFSIANMHFVIYSEGKGYFKYFKNIMEYILEHSNVTVHYITIDPNDVIFELAKENPQIKPYYISEKRLITLMMKLEADIVLMSTPDLENFYIKRSYIKKDVEYIYTNHGIGSDNVMLRANALDHFDTIFCVGPHSKDEIRAREKIYNLPEKKLIETGYCLTDEMDATYAKLEKVENEIKTILIAPSWQKDNIMDLCLDELLDGIVGKGYKVIVRPHPQYVRIYPAKMQRILDKYKDKMDENFIIETDFSSNATVYNSDLIVTDWSSIGCEFNFITYKPTLYINTPMKVMNPEWEKLGIVPFDIEIRDKLGASLDVDRMDTVYEVVQKLIDETDIYKKNIKEWKEKSVYNLGHCAEVSGQYILNSLKEKQEQRRKEQ